MALDAVQSAIIVLADTVASLHAGLILFDFRGAFAVIRGDFRCKSLRRWHNCWIGLVAAKSVSALTIGDCPLTLIEQHLRKLSRSGSAFDESFVAHYLSWLPHEVDSSGSALLLLAGLVAILQMARRDNSLQRATVPSRSGCEEYDG